MNETQRQLLADAINDLEHELSRLADRYISENKRLVNLASAIADKTQRLSELKEKVDW